MVAAFLLSENAAFFRAFAVEPYFKHANPLSLASEPQAYHVLLRYHSTKGIEMAKKKKATSRKQKSSAGNAAVPVSKQTAGGITGAVIGGVVAGPIGALAGGAVGAMVGESSAKGKKPIKRAVTAIRDEVSSGSREEGPLLGLRENQAYGNLKEESCQEEVDDNSQEEKGKGC